ncbi:MAG TPA: PEP-CTERM sorting domain-containing protein, partial [Tepidisphaeraceae bacterium]|nr:PEP-CTERM sorting domain-containing protein [Tepidisphaeraceae bacterium]
LNSTNAFTGGSTVPAGTRLVATAPGALGGGAVSLNGGTLSIGSQQQVALSGFSNFSLNGNSNSTTAAVPNIAGSVLNLTTNAASEASSAFNKTQVTMPALNSANGFTANFTYQAGGSKAADGVAFILQNASTGSAALGSNGGGYGYGGITPSASLQINIYTNNTIGTAVATNGAITTPDITSSPVNPGSGDAINVALSYNGVTHALTETLTDPTASTTYTHTFALDIQSALVGDQAYIGFSGGTGGSTASQSVSNFTFTSGAATPTAASFTNAVSVLDGTTSTVEVNSAANNNAAALGALTLGAGSQLNITGGASLAANTPYSLAFGATTLGGNSTINVANNGTASASVVLGSVSGGSSTLTKTGAGTLFLNSGSTATGLTSVTAGTLGGKGSFAGPITASGGGTLAPSALQTTLVGAPMAITGPVSISGATLGISINSSATPGVNYDQIQYSSTFALDSATLAVADSGYIPLSTDQFWVVDGLAGSSAVAGSFTNGSTITGPSGTLYYIYTNIPGDPASTGHDVVLSTSPVPEPASAALLGLGAIGLLLKRRRRS